MCAIFVERSGVLVEMAEQPFERESELQRHLAKHPDLLSAEAPEEERRRWLLVKREAGVPDRDGGTSRWSLDHLFVDQDGIPTFVEVKRAVNTDVRRKVVGQMLDYAANASTHWDAGTLRSAFNSGRPDQEAADRDLSDFLEGAAEPEEFWNLVAANLEARKLRLVFVSDRIPRELRSIVEFLNEQLPETEVLAIEIKQYAEPDGDRVNVVPQIIGDTEVARRAKRPGRAQWSRTQAELEAHIRARFQPDLAQRVLALYEYARADGGRQTFGHGKQPSATVWMGERREDPRLANPVALRFGDASVWVLTRDLASRRGPEEMDRLADLLEALPGAAPVLADVREKHYRRHAKLPVDQVLATDERLEQFKQVLAAAIEPPSG